VAQLIRSVKRLLNRPAKKPPASVETVAKARAKA